MEFSFQKLLRHGEVDFFKLEKDICILKDMLVLPNNQIVVASSKSLKLYDENFNLIQCIETINDQKLAPDAIDFNQNEKCLYMSDWHKRCIFKVDLHFVLIKMINLKKPYCVIYHFGICFKNDCLLVCDANDYEIKVYDKNLEFQNSIKIDYEPIQIKASNSTICVCSRECVYFYRKHDLSFYQKFEGIGGERISLIDSVFHVSNSFTKTYQSCFNEMLYAIKNVPYTLQIHCFNEDGNLKEVIKFGEMVRFYGNMCTFAKLNNDLLMISTLQMCKFKI